MNVENMLPAGLLDGFKDGAQAAAQHFNYHMDRICTHLGAMHGAILDLNDRAEIFLPRAQGQADGAGDAEILIEGPEAGFHWKLQRLTVVVRDGPATAGILFRGQVISANAVQYLAVWNGIGSLAGSPGILYLEQIQPFIYVPPSVPLYLVLSGCPPNAGIEVGMQVINEPANLP